LHRKPVLVNSKHMFLYKVFHRKVRVLTCFFTFSTGTAVEREIFLFFLSGGGEPYVAVLWVKVGIIQVLSAPIFVKARYALSCSASSATPSEISASIRSAKLTDDAKKNTIPCSPVIHNNTADTTQKLPLTILGTRNQHEADLSAKQA